MNQAMSALKEGDRIFIIIERRQIKEARFFGETGCNDGSAWVVLPEHWDGDRESMCMACQAYQWATSHAGVANRLREILINQKQELIRQIAEINFSLADLAFDLSSNP